VTKRVTAVPDAVIVGAKLAHDPVL